MDGRYREDRPPSEAHVPPTPPAVRVSSAARYHNKRRIVGLIRRGRAKTRRAMSSGASTAGGLFPRMGLRSLSAER